MSTAVKLNAQQRAIVKQAIANIKAKPDQFDMDHWVGRNQCPKSARTCGTSACLAGHVVLAAGLRPKDGDYVPAKGLAKVLGVNIDQLTVKELGDGRFYTAIPDAAARILGMDGDTARDLFHAEYWPEPYRSDFKAATYTGQDEYGDMTTDYSKRALQKRAKLAIGRLRHKLKTGE